MEVGIHRGTGQRLEGGLGAEHPRRPIGLRIHAAEQAEGGPPHGNGQGPAQALFHRVQAVAPVAGEALVAAVARQRDRHVPAGELADAVGRQRGAVRIGLVVSLGENVDQIEIVALHPVDEVPRVVARRHLPGERRLVESRIAERDRARVHGFGAHARHHRDDGARIHAAGEKRAERHLGDHAQPDRLPQAIDQLRLRLALGDRIVEGEAHIPVLARLGDGLAAPDRERVRRRQLGGARIDGARLRNVAEREILFDRKRIELAPEARMGQQRLELGAEDEQPVGQQRVMKRLHAEPVAREEQRLPVAVPQREGEHAAEALDAGFAPLLPGMDDHLGIAPGVKAVAALGELGNQLLVVVDLAVEHDHHAAVLVEQRLLARGQIDDGQPPMAEAEPRLEVQPALVGSAVVLRLVHARDEIARDRPRALQVHDADDAAHIASALSEGRPASRRAQAPRRGMGFPSAAPGRRRRRARARTGSRSPPTYAPG